MNRYVKWFVVGILILLALVFSLPRIYAGPQQKEEEPFSEITVQMYRLNPPGGGNTSVLCQINDPAIPNDGDINWGCTAFPGDNTASPYPYPTNPVAVSI